MSLIKVHVSLSEITEPEGSFGYFNNMDDLIDVVPGQSSDVFSMSSKTGKNGRTEDVLSAKLGCIISRGI